MAPRPPQRPRPVDSVGSLSVSADDTQSMSRAVDTLVDAFNRLKQSASAPTVNRLTLNVTSPATNIELSLYTDGTDAWFLDGDGNRVQLTSNGAVNAGGGAGTSVPYSTYWYSPIWVASNVLDTRGPTNDVCRAMYMGRAPVDLSEIGVRWSQTAGGTITYAEWGIATGAFVPGSASSLVLRGYVDAATEWASSGLRQLTIPVTGADIAADTDIWLCYSVSFSAGAPTIAVSNITDRLDSNQFLTRAATRISTNLNTAPLAFTAENVTPVTAAFFLT